MFYHVRLVRMEKKLDLILQILGERGTPEEAQKIRDLTARLNRSTTALVKAAAVKP